MRRLRGPHCFTSSTTPTTVSQSSGVGVTLKRDPLAERRLRPVEIILATVRLTIATPATEAVSRSREVASAQQPDAHRAGSSPG